LTRSRQNPDTPLRLVQISDPHLRADPAGMLRGVATLPALRAVLAAAATDIAACDALLVTGDLVQDDPGGYAHLRAALTPLGKPVLCIPGNHDSLPALRVALGQPAAQGQSPFILDGPVDLRHWRILLLDSTVPDQPAGLLSDAELQRLDRQLAAAPQRPALIALHHHPVPVGGSMDTMALTNATQFFAVLDRHPQVRAIVCGHVHQSHETQRRDVRILTAPSTCVQFLPNAATFAVDDQPAGWRLLRLHADGRVESEVRRLS
jgi:Icc protein